jgi:hypothetical protein
MLTLFKNALFDSPLLEDNHILPISEWNKLQHQEMHEKHMEMLKRRAKEQAERIESSTKLSSADKKELLQREKFWIENNECVNKIKNLNMTEDERKESIKIYRENNKDKIKETKKISDKKYREKNVDKLKEKKKDYYNKNKDNEEFKELHKERSKKHYINIKNKDEFKVKNRTNALNYIKKKTEETGLTQYQLLCLNFEKRMKDKLYGDIKNEFIDKLNILLIK